MKHGLNVAICAVYGPVEASRKIQRQDRAVIDVRYNMAHSLPAIEFDQVLTEGPEKFRKLQRSLESVVLVERFLVLK